MANAAADDKEIEYLLIFTEIDIDETKAINLIDMLKPRTEQLKSTCGDKLGILKKASMAIADV
jgi:hypothetical protein